MTLLSKKYYTSTLGRERLKMYRSFFCCSRTRRRRKGGKKKSWFHLEFITDFLMIRIKVSMNLLKSLFNWVFQKKNCSGFENFFGFVILIRISAHSKLSTKMIDYIFQLSMYYYILTILIIRPCLSIITEFQLVSHPLNSSIKM